jgi:hypothetical protein
MGLAGESQRTKPELGPEVQKPSTNFSGQKTPFHARARVKNEGGVCAPSYLKSQEDALTNQRHNVRRTSKALSAQRGYVWPFLAPSLWLLGRYCHGWDFFFGVFGRKMLKCSYVFVWMQFQQTTILWGDSKKKAAKPTNAWVSVCLLPMMTAVFTP